VQQKFYPHGQDVTFQIGVLGKITEIGKATDPRQGQDLQMSD